MTATATTTPATRHAKRMLSRYRRLKQQGRCMCGRRARARRVKCRRCALADNARSKRRYAVLVHALDVLKQDYMKAVGTCPHHD